MPAPNYIPTSQIEDAIKAQLEGHMGDVVDEVIVFDGDPVEAMNERFGRPGFKWGPKGMIIFFGAVSADPTEASDSGLQLHTAMPIAFILVRRLRGMTSTDEDRRALNAAADALEWEAFHPDVVDDVGLADHLYKYVQRMTNQGRATLRGLDFGKAAGRVAGRTVRFLCTPHRTKVA